MVKRTQAIHCVNIDALDIAISVYHCIPDLHELWVEFGRGKDLKYITVYRIPSNYGVMSTSALPFFHVLSVYDTTSLISGKSKKTFYNENFFQKLQNCL